jgi:hypothetical protein
MRKAKGEHVRVIQRRTFPSEWCWELIGADGHLVNYSPTVRSRVECVTDAELRGLEVPAKRATRGASEGPGTRADMTLLLGSND